MKQNNLGLRDFDKLVEHRKITDKIIHNPIPIDEIEEVLERHTVFLIQGKEGYDYLMDLVNQEAKKYFKEQEEIRDNYYKLLNDV